MEQYNLFGEIVEVKGVLRSTRKLKTMQELYGCKENKICKTCMHLFKLEYHDKTYYKCELWKMSNSQATDIRLKNKACMKWKLEK